MDEGGRATTIKDRLSSVRTFGRTTTVDGKSPRRATKYGGTDFAQVYYLLRTWVQ